ncbi:hypothetical protein HJC99_04515 [Candidatus Saccharibacteria bacterium]|nr:hypothetical protein [Candidatus Saccharibacteria bacterium]
MKRLWWWVVGAVLVVGLIVIMGLLLAPKNPIPGPIKKQVTSTLLMPRGAGAVVDRQSVKYDSAQKLLTFNVAYAGTSIVVSQQPTPDQFVDIPAVYTKLIDSLVNYQSFDTSIGTVHLTQPKQLNGKQAAVLNTMGTLMFAKPDKNLSDDQWRSLFNHMAAIN